MECCLGMLPGLVACSLLSVWSAPGVYVDFGVIPRTAVAAGTPEEKHMAGSKALEHGLLMSGGGGVLVPVPHPRVRPRRRDA